MKKAFAVIICLICIVSGCGVGSKEVNNIPAYTVIIDSTFTNQQKQNMIDDLLEWQIKTNGLVQYAISFDNLSDLSLEMPAIDNTIFIYKYNNIGPNILGWTEWNAEKNTARILMDDLQDDTLFKAVMLHELGHAFHLGHYMGCNFAIMHPYIGDTYNIECQDLKQFCDIWDCKIDCVPGIDPSFTTTPTTVSFEPSM
jgi:hypothetical protein